jgi:multiple sugar transport system ATP-binding protein
MIEAMPHAEPYVETFETVLDQTEPMGVETLGHFIIIIIDGAEVCGRSIPTPARATGPRSDWRWTSTTCTC